MEHEGSKQFLKEHGADHYPELDESSPQIQTFL
jgi:hypothetical protein